MQGHNSLPNWLNPTWQRLQTMHGQGRLPHAMVLSGAKGLGKRQLAEQLMASLVCLQPQQGQACEQCKSCLLRHANSHPDIKRLAPEEEGKAILVDPVRKIQPWLAGTSQQGGAKVVIIEPANELNVNAANALLKNLEEPGNNTFFILLHDWPKPLLATIKSRCQSQEISIPEGQTALQWLSQQQADTAEDSLQQVLKMAHGAPLMALKYLQQEAPALRHQSLVDLTAILRNQTSVSAVAETWIKADVKQVLDWWLQWVQDLIKLQQTQDPQLVVNQDILKLLQAIAKKANIKQVFNLHDELLNSLDSLVQRRNINQQLMLEKLLYQWYQLV